MRRERESDLGYSPTQEILCQAMMCNIKQKLEIAARQEEGIGVPHGSQRQTVSQLGIIGQHGGEEVTGKSMHGNTLAEHNLAKSTERPS